MDAKRPTTDKELESDEKRKELESDEEREKLVYSNLVGGHSH